MNMNISLAAARYGLLGAFGLSVFFVMYALAGAPSRVASRLGMRGLKRRRAIENSEVWGGIEPLVRWLGVRFNGVLGEGLVKALDRQIALAGDYLGLTPEEYVALSLVGAVGGGAFGVVAASISGSSAELFALIGAMLGAAVPYLQVSGEAKERRKVINRGLPYVIDLMALSMSAGLDFPGSIRQVIEKSSNPEDPLIEEMTRILQELQLGKTRKQALADFAERAPADAVKEFVAAIVQAEERGNPVADVLQIQAQVSRMRRTVAAEEAASKAGVKMVGPLFLLFGCIMILVVAPMILKLSSQE
jgi:tight adherence protein C